MTRAGPRVGLEHVADLIGGLTSRHFKRRQRLAEAAFLRSGVTFSVYSDRRGVEKIFPFDLIPRVISASEWERVNAGLEQRVRALNLFLSDLYGPQKTIKDGIVPAEIVLGASGFFEDMVGVRPPGGVHVHIAGIDLIKRPDGRFVVLEDNARVPSGVSYVLENRAMMKRVIPTVFSKAHVKSVDEYPIRLREALLEMSPEDPASSSLVVLTPGPLNSAYFEHSFLARRMGCPLVQGTDLFVWQEKVYLKTTRGPQRIHVIYRRIDDDFLDPTVFREDSMLGVPGLISAYRAGNVAVANAIGNGVVDDKSTYAVIPDVIRYFLAEEPLLDQVPTYLCARDEDRQYVLDHLAELVVKEVDGAGGYGMLIGPKAAKSEIEEFRTKIEQEPRGFIAQPLLDFSTCPSWTADGVGPRRVDLRPFVVTGRSSWVLPGGLTRVALREGSYVVNSSQGGGSKDTWVLEDWSSQALPIEGLAQSQEQFS